MILSGLEIARQVALGDISISPFNPDQLNPNSYNYRLGSSLLIHKDSSPSETFIQIEIPEDGYILHPGVLCLGYTHEVLGSSKYAMSLIGRSSIGRLGLFLQISANLGHKGSAHKWTLELFSCHPIKLYKEMIIGQLSFWETCGEISPPREVYSKLNEPAPSRGYEFAKAKQ